MTSEEKERFEELHTLFHAIYGIVAIASEHEQDEVMQGVFEALANLANQGMEQSESMYSNT